MSAFGYVLPDDQPQRMRLAACFLLVAAERGVNLAVPVLFKQVWGSVAGGEETLCAEYRVVCEGVNFGF